MFKVDEEDVRSAYRVFFNRNPESDEVIRQKVEQSQPFGEFVRSFVVSEEYAGAKRSVLDDVHIQYWSSGPRVDVEVPQNDLDSMIDRVRQQWSKLGDENPYWSVLTDDQYRNDVIDPAKIDSFYTSGSEAASIMDVFERRTNIEGRRGTCVELGCGVGRVTRWLAEKFEKVIALDISPGNLSICQNYLEQQKIDNVEIRLLRSVEDLHSLPHMDYFYSIIVLQHNPPPVQKVMLEAILSRLNVSGCCLFQTPDYIPGYEFAADKVDDLWVTDMDMHCLPKRVVFDILRRNKISVLDVAPDDFTGMFGSYTYFGIKSAA